MREITTKVYKYDELSDTAKEKAVQQISEKLMGAWWDQYDIDQLADTMRYGLAGELKSPGWDKFGEGDFPGIVNIELVEWDLDRGQSIKFEGTLSRDNAPALPWVDGINSVRLNHSEYVRSIWVDLDDDGEVKATKEQIDAMRKAVADAIHKAWKAGRDQLDYMEGEEYAKGWIEANEPEFTEDGSHFA